MRARFLTSVALSDLTSLVVAMVAASLIVFATPLPWNAGVVGSTFPMLAFMFVSMIATSIFTAQMSGPGVPRPTYGRMVAILFGTVFLTAGLIVLFRDVYFSRAFLAYSSAIWLIPAISHRAWRRRRPWTERIGVITQEKQLADDLHDSDHANVVWVLSPSFDGPIDLPEKDVTIAIDLRAVQIGRASCRERV